MRLLIADSITADVVTGTVADAARPGTEIVAVTGRVGARVIGTRTELAIGEHATVELLAEHAAGGDAAIIAASYPVALAAACMLGGRVGAVGFGTRVLPLYGELIARYGLGGRVQSCAVRSSTSRRAGSTAGWRRPTRLPVP